MQSSLPVGCEADESDREKRVKQSTKDGIGMVIVWGRGSMA